MEVHHHPHLPHGAKKNFKEYLLEGLMIFFAVFMGFIAENVREHISDSSKEKNYIASLGSDLKKDSAQQVEIINLGNKLRSGQDSLLNLLQVRKLTQQQTNEVYHLFFSYGSSVPIFNSTERTLNQLINSGNFRLIEKSALADSITSYYDNVKAVSFQASVNTTNAMDCIEFAQNIFKFDYGLHPGQQQKSFITYESDTIEKYRNKLTQMRISQQFYIAKDIAALHKSCVNLLSMLGDNR